MKRQKRFVSFYRKTFMVLFTGIMLLVLVAGSTIFFIYYQYYVGTLANYNTQTISYTREKLGDLLSDVVGATDNLFLDTTVNSILTDPAGVSRNQSAFQQYFSRHPFSDSLFSCQIELFDLYGNKYTYYNTAAFTHNLLEHPDIARYAWCDDVVGAGGQILWVSGETLHPDGGDMLFALRLVKNARANQPIGVVAVSFPKRYLQTVLKNRAKEQIGIFLTQPDGPSLLAWANNSTETAAFKLESARMAGEMRGFYTDRVSNMLVVYEYDNLTRHYVVQTTELPTLSGFFLQLIAPLCVVVLGAGGVAAAGCYRLYRRVSDPILVLVQSMKQLEAGDMSLPELDTARDDEIGHLNRGYRNMLHEITLAMERLLAEQEQKRAASLAALQAQINPHFLYNTLGSARYLIQIQQPEDASAVLISLVKLLKVNLDTRHDRITVRREVECLRCYALIQTYKNEQFRMEYDIGDCMDCLLPKLLIQPLVENSIFHGFGGARIRGIVTVSIQRREEQLHVGVHDNGVGIPAEKLRTLLQGGREGSIGLRNVNDRLLLWYGPEAALRIHNRPGGGVSIEFTIPAREGESHASDFNC